VKKLAALFIALATSGCSARDLAAFEPVFGCRPMPVDEFEARRHRTRTEWIPARDEARPLRVDDYRLRRS